METRPIGSLTVSAIGLGTNNFGLLMDERNVAPVVNAALEAGSTFFDTSDSYGESERRLGRSPRITCPRASRTRPWALGTRAADCPDGARLHLDRVARRRVGRAERAARRVAGVRAHDPRKQRDQPGPHLLQITRDLLQITRGRAIQASTGSVASPTALAVARRCATEV
jgi:hypothetical protein